MKHLALLLVVASFLGFNAPNTAPLPLRRGFLNLGNASHASALDTIAHPGANAVPCSVAYLGHYIIALTLRGEVYVSTLTEGGKCGAPVFSPTNAFELENAPVCSGASGDKIVFVSITDGYVQPKRYTVVELSLARRKFVRHYRSRSPICATYSADGTQIQVETQGTQQALRSAY